MVYDFFESLLSILSSVYFVEPILKLYLQNLKQEYVIISEQANFMSLFFLFIWSFVVSDAYLLYAWEWITFLF